MALVLKILEMALGGDIFMNNEKITITGNKKIPQISNGTDGSDRSLKKNTNWTRRASLY